MKINISVQRKTNIESNQTPNQKTKKQPKQISAGGRTARTGGRTGGHGCGGRTGGERAVGPVKNRSEKLF